jgi:NADH:ubiquinone oxidoreductase subunit K
VGVTILLTKQAFTFSDNFFWFSSDVSFFVGLGLNSILFSIFIFLIGGFGIIFNRKDILWLMVSIEIMFLGISLVFIFTFVFFDTPLSIIYSFIIVSLAAAEAAIGFGLLVGSFSLRPNISFSRFNHLKG